MQFVIIIISGVKEQNNTQIVGLNNLSNEKQFIKYGIIYKSPDEIS